MSKLIHPFKPIYNKESKILILGSFPSVKSREDNFYYAHPQNRFWRLLANILKCNTPTTVDEKKEMLLKNNIAIWDVLSSCDIVGSSDASIKNPVVNDISGIIKKTKITKVFFNGKKAFEVYNKYNNENLDINFEVLPSSSPANAMWSFEKLYEYWNNVIKEKL